MASLKEVRNLSRHILAIGAIGVVAIFLIVMLVQIGKAIVNTIHPPQAAKPTVAFGKLPTIHFPESQMSPNLTYSLNTLSGNLPDFGDRATVYKMNPAEPNLLALENAKSLVTKVGFLQDPTQISDSEYMWTNTDDLPKRLTVNIFTNNFTLDSDFMTNQDVLSAKNLSDENNAIGNATQFLQNFGLLPQDINTDKTKVTLLSISNGQLIPATSLSTAQIIRVDFFQDDINNLPIFYPQATYSTMYFLIGGGNVDSQIVSAHFTYHAVGQNSATYPIISAKDAYAALQKGQGYIASYDSTDTHITIHNVVMGYYIGETAQNYLQPIIVFEGDHGFFAYIPAVTADWIQQ